MKSLVAVTVLRPLVATIFVAVVVLNHTVHADPLAGEVTVDFTATHPDSIVMLWKGNRLSPASRMIPEKEGIERYPDNWKVKETFHLCIQEHQYYYSLAQKSKKDHQRVIEVFGEEWFDEAKSKYTDQDVDCVVSFCTIENADGEEFVVCDANNDEDFTNDEVLTYGEGEEPVGLFSKLKTKIIETIAEVEYFDGQSIQTQPFPVSFRKVFGKQRVTPEGALRRIMVGELALGQDRYMVALIGRGIEHNKDSHLWVDENGNRKFDISWNPLSSDFIERMNSPFELQGETYEVTYVDQFGRRIILQKSDAEVAARIKRGMAAPSFEAVTLDSVVFRLGDAKGRYILLDFWGTWCGPCIAEIPFLKEARETYTDEDLRIVSVGVDNRQKLQQYVQEKRLNWTHIQVGKENELLRLYQVRGYPSTFLINNTGYIVAMGPELRSDALAITLRKFLE